MIYQRKNVIFKSWIIFFLVAFIVGILLMNSLGNWFVSEAGIFNAASMNRLKDMEINQGVFLLYVLKTRIKDLLILAMFSTTCFGIMAVYCNIIWQGFLTGMMLTAVFIRFGIKGLFLIMAGLFPHQLLLVPAGVMMWAWCYQNCSFVYYPRRYYGPKFHNKKQQYIRQGLLFLWILSIVIIGCILECYVNPILISDIIKII